METSPTVSAREARGSPSIPISEEVWNSEIAAGKAMSSLKQRDKGTCGVEKSSIYGLAFALPQIARTAGYSRSYVKEMINGFVFLVLNIFVQGFLLYMIGTSERVLDICSGQMHLCDFGAEITTKCPDGPNCIGPGGTPIEQGRIWEYEQWSVRMFLREGLSRVFPEKFDDIRLNIDPGEYGLESYHLRMICCFLFVMSLWSDLAGTLDMGLILLSVPTAAEPWMAYEVPTWDSKERVKLIHGWSELDLVKFRIAGMPCCWKFINIIIIVIPKLVLWLITIDIGVLFLLETAKIEEMIINSVTLGLILRVDELICETCSSSITKTLVSKLEDFPLYIPENNEDETENETFTKHQAGKDWRCWSPAIYIQLAQKRVLCMVVMTAFYIWKYYIEKCIREPDGSWVARPVHEPLFDTLPFLSFIFGPVPKMFPVLEHEQRPARWQMPVAQNMTAR